MKHIQTIITALFLLIFSVAMLAQPSPKFVKFTVKSVHDGDTFVVQDSAGNQHTVRPIGYDCPEVRSNIILETQPYGRIAGDTLRKLIKGKTVLLDTTALKNGVSRDQYGRLLAEAYFADSSSVALWMTVNGLAWAFETKGRVFPKMNTIIRDAHREARTAKRNLWQGYIDKGGKWHAAVAPWTHRKKFSIND